MTLDGYSVLTGLTENVNLTGNMSDHEEKKDLGLNSDKRTIQSHRCSVYTVSLYYKTPHIRSYSITKHHTFTPIVLQNTTHSLLWYYKTPHIHSYGITKHHTFALMVLLNTTHSLLVFCNTIGVNVWCFVIP
jgi:hypothetical protein